MAHDKEALKKHLLSFFKKRAEQKESDNFESDKEAFLFHMTDWADDLAPLAALYEQPEDFSQEESHKVLWSVFFHILEHVLAAAEIYDDWPELYRSLMRKRRDA